MNKIPSCLSFVFFLFSLRASIHDLLYRSHLALGDAWSKPPTCFLTFLTILRVLSLFHSFENGPLPIYLPRLVQRFPIGNSVR